MQKYTEHLWYESVRNEYQMEGHINIPNPKSSPLPLDKQITRKEEVQIMGLFYNNNLLNSFLHRFDKHRFPSPLCHCQREEQTAYHVAVSCDRIDEDIRSELCANIQRVVGASDAAAENNITLLNASRDPEVMRCLFNVMNLHKNFLLTEIEL